MKDANERIREWWTAALLGQSESAHPVFGEDIHVHVDGDVVTLTGTVESVEQRQEVENEARGLDFVSTVVNHLDVMETPGETFHMQTVVALFDRRETAELARGAISAATLHEQGGPEVIDDPAAAERRLTRLAQNAHIDGSAVEGYVTAVRDGKVLLADRVPEDDVLRVLSTLEGSQANSYATLPPEPDATEGREA